MREVHRKFVDTIDVDGWEIETDSGWQPVTAIHKTIPYLVWSITTESGKVLNAADDHIIFDENLGEIFIKECKLDSTRIMTIDGPELVTSIKQLEADESMYDLTVESKEHRFYTNGILSHNSTCTLGYMLWKILFQDQQKCAIFANRAVTARGLLKKIRFAYSEIPLWMQRGVVEWNKGSIELENGSSVIADATSEESGRSGSYNLALLDEFAFVEANKANEFYAAVEPTLTSGTTTQLVIVSTPNGMNKFYEMWQGALSKTNPFLPIEIHYKQVPGRDEDWERRERQLLGDDGFAQEYLGEFLGSGTTLISTSTLKELNACRLNPLYLSDNFWVYEQPQENHTYTIIVDVSEGQGQDYSAFSVIDITQLPYKQVAKYRDKEIAAVVYPNIIYAAAKKYNDAYILIETNDIGAQIGSTLHYDLEYENLLMTNSVSKGIIQTQELTMHFGKGARLGVMMSAKVKKIGCLNLKSLIENHQLIVNDSDTISELTNFVVKGKSFAAEPGMHDDLVMTLVLFGWLAAQKQFKEFTNLDMRLGLQEKTRKAEENILPFGFMDDGLEHSDDSFTDEDGDTWFTITPEQQAARDFWGYSKKSTSS